MNVFLIIVGMIMVYAFLGKLMFHFVDYLCRDWTYSDRENMSLACGSCLPLAIVVLFVIMLVKFPMKLADFISDPKNYKFAIKIERKK